MKQKFGIISDLHMEFQDWDFIPAPGVHYLCAGDIHSGRVERMRFVDKHADHMTWIRGNHDFYDHEDFGSQSPGKIVEVNGFKIAAATLWTDLTAPMEWFRYIRGLVDSRYINNLEYSSYTHIHTIQKEFLLNSGADIIMSHHCPSYLSVGPEFEGDPLNPCFVTDLDYEISHMEKPPQLWVCGHTHHKHEYMLGKVHIVANPRGYPREYSDYNDYAPRIIELEK